MEGFFDKDGEQFIGYSDKEQQELQHIYDAAGNRYGIKIPDLATEWKQVEERINHDIPVKKLPFSNLAKIAASLLILIISAWILFATLIKGDVYVSKNDIKTIELPDGSEVILNKNSKLIVASEFNKSSRKVTLNGEAYFKVSKSNHAFIIDAGFTKVEVVGTAFNVKTKNTKVEVAVNEGIVTFANQQNDEGKIQLTKGFLSTCIKNENPEIPQKIVFDEYPGWLFGKLNFQNHTLDEICQELEANFNMNIEIVEDSIAQKTITGTLDSNTPDEIIQILCTLINQNFRIEKGKYVIY